MNVMCAHCGFVRADHEWERWCPTGGTTFTAERSEAPKASPTGRPAVADSVEPELTSWGHVASLRAELREANLTFSLNSKSVLTITHEGRFVLKEGATMDEAALALVKAGESVFGELLRDRERLDWLEAQSHTDVAVNIYASQDGKAINVFCEATDAVGAGLRAAIDNGRRMSSGQASPSEETK